jgi:SAM-dependent methyltransferase
MTARFEPRRFRSTVPFYARYRMPYPDVLIEFVAEHCGLDRASRVLDLGCGPGLLAVGFARLGFGVVAMDPEPTMLEAAQERARDANVTIETVEGSSYDLTAALGRFRLVTMGRSFHWMDRDTTLGVLDGLVEDGGAVALFGDRRIDAPGQDWRALVEQLRETFVPGQAAERRRRKLEEAPHETVLLRSRFAALERHGVIATRRLSQDDVVGRVYSTSSTSPEALGDRRSVFEHALREALTRLSPSGEFDEIVEVYALIARRPPP